jgi:hypothetical protein
MALATMKFKDSIKITKVRKWTDSPNSLVMKIIYLEWRIEIFLYNILIGYKDFHLNHHWRMESSSTPIGS